MEKLVVNKDSDYDSVLEKCRVNMMMMIHFRFMLHKKWLK